MNESRKQDQLIEGVVSGHKANKTVTVVVRRMVKHEKYDKYLRRESVFHVHDERNEAEDGDRVVIRPTRPLSKTKHWRLVRIVEKAKKV
ncbi:MAG: 30S ribosomal protein S17 [Phycisphaerae bacterium]|nr:30S ribosomal protein S17 [Phycisphaerae bacterium]